MGATQRDDRTFFGRRSAVGLSIAVVVALAIGLTIVRFEDARNAPAVPPPPPGNGIVGSRAEAKRAVSVLAREGEEMSAEDASWYGTHFCSAFNGGVSWERFIALADALHAEQPQLQHTRAIEMYLMSVYCRQQALTLAKLPVPPDLLPSPSVIVPATPSSDATTSSLSPSPSPTKA